jgi:hypothetical protein
LLNFRDGRRHYGLMTRMVDPLSDAYLLEIAQHFSALDLPYPVPAPASASPGLLHRGEQLVRQGDAPRGVPACVSVPWNAPHRRGSRTFLAWSACRATT